MKAMILLILFDPDTYVWLIMAGLVIVTLLLWLLYRWVRRRWLRWGLLLTMLFLWYVVIYGLFIGVRQLEVRHVEFASRDLPAAFDGYRIVQFGDLHLPFYKGWREPLLREVLDSINAQHGDVIVFTGDLQNKLPEEIKPHIKTLSRLKAPDGVWSVMGNHDYAMYVDCDAYMQEVYKDELLTYELKAGWRVLLNQHKKIRRGGDSIYIAGMENDGEGRFPQEGSVVNSLYGLTRESFVVMLQHDPTAWRRKILPRSHCQLTLSGHTHGGQFSLLGLSPARLRYREYDGMYYIGERAMNVTRGLGGVIPFRFGTPPEIVVITLRKK